MPAASPPDDPDRPIHVAPRPPGSRLVAVLLAAAALVAAIITTRASVVANDATGLWQRALRQEVIVGAGASLEIRATYLIDGPDAFRYATARVREEELRKIAATSDGDVRDALLLDAEVQKRLAEGMLTTADIPGDPRYALSTGGYDLIRWLADRRAEETELLALDPEGTAAEGEQPARKARSLMVTTIPVGLAFMFGALGQAFVSRRRLLLVIGTGALVGGALLALLVELGL